MDTLFIQNTTEKESINAEKMLFVKTETKPFNTERIFCAFYRGTSIRITLASRKIELDI